MSAESGNRWADNSDQRRPKTAVTTCLFHSKDAASKQTAALVMLVSAGLVVEVDYTGVDVPAWLASVQESQPGSRVDHGRPCHPARLGHRPRQRVTRFDCGTRQRVSRSPGEDPEP